jgi:asparagine synthase (glutamine-hydrolysing)
VCGLAGILDPRAQTSGPELEAIVSAMAGTLHHRGPDDSGTWVDPTAGIALGSQRLAVIDLTAEGHQPMVSASGRYVVAFNGEIYNFPALRTELEGKGHRFRGYSDTEVLLAATEEWGPERALERFNGMFAYALWDAGERTLLLARDRLGEKPLYCGWAGRTLIFGSELKALRVHPAFRAEIDRDAVALYLRHKYVPAPHSVYRAVSKLPPGSFLTIDREGRASDPTVYWAVSDAASRGLSDPFQGSVEEAAEAMDALLRDAVALRMVADVPLGAFLSGGIDSSTIVALMQAQSARPVRTFTVGFHEDSYNEAREAKRVAGHLGTDHTEVYVTAEEARSVIPRLPEIYDEPFADSSQIPTFLVAELARRHVTVSLSGDGGDEVFGGYLRHFWAGTVWKRTEWMPRALRRALSAGLTSLSPDAWDSVMRIAGPLLPGTARQRNPGDKLHKLAGALGADRPYELYLALVSHWRNPASVVRGVTDGVPLDREWDGATAGDFTEQMMLLDSETYLPDDILAKLDRATMAVSLEGRVPYLDHRVVELAWRLPLSMKVGDHRGKLLLRRILGRYVPLQLVERPKMGFGVPVSDWLRGPLRGWAEELLDAGRLRAEGFFNPAPIRAAWRDHLSGRLNREFELWDILMFQSWLESNERRGVPVS